MKCPEYWLSFAVSEALPKRRALAADIGANVGSWSEAMSTEFQAVVAAEPDPRAYNQIPDLPNVTVERVAVGEEPGEAEFFLHESPGHNSLLPSHPIGGEGGAKIEPVATTDVQVVTLDQLLPAGADFVKIDIEGGEVAALRGCKRLDSWKHAVFLVECHDTFDAVAVELQRLGKSVRRLPHPFPGHPGHCWAIGT